MNPPPRIAKHERERLIKLTLFEAQAKGQGYTRVAGLDEAGRGPLAGPLVAAACVIHDGLYFEGINDSKLLTPKRRRELFEQLVSHPLVEWSYSVVEVDLIDVINILEATRLAMKRAVLKLALVPEYLLIDALHIDVKNVKQEKIIKGDQLSQSIAAASIIAKEVRDEIMVDLHRAYPQYGFDAHKGYGTAHHLEALRKHGPCPAHRKSFAPIKSFFLNNLSFALKTL